MGERWMARAMVRARGAKAERGKEGLLGCARTRARRRRVVRKRNGITKLVGEWYLHLRRNKPILCLSSPSPHPLIHLSFREDRVQPGCNQPFPNWTAFHVGGPPLRMRVCFTGIFISAALRRDGRSSIRGVPTPPTPIHGRGRGR